MRSQQLFGLGAQSDLEFVGIPFSDSPSEISFRRWFLGKPQRHFLEPLYFEGANRNSVWIHQDGVATALVENHKRVFFDPFPLVEPGDLQNFLLHQTLAAILILRGFLALHASAVEMDEEAFLFLGDAGAGKSTLAAALHLKGLAVGSDDVAAIRFDADAPIFQPGPAQLKLHCDSPLLASRVAPKGAHASKVLLKAESARPAAARRIAAIYLLEHGSETVIEKADPFTALARLTEDTYALPLHAIFGRQTEHLQLVGAVLRHVPVHRFRRPRNFDTFSESTNLLLSHMRAQSKARSAPPAPIHGLPALESR